MEPVMTFAGSGLDRLAGSMRKAPAFVDNVLSDASTLVLPFKYSTSPLVVSCEADGTTQACWLPLQVITKAGFQLVSTAVDVAKATATTTTTAAASSSTGTAEQDEVAVTRIYHWTILGQDRATKAFKIGALLGKAAEGPIEPAAQAYLAATTTTTTTATASTMKPQFIGGRQLFLGSFAGPASSLAEIGQAAAFLTWHEKSVFCGTCGAPTRPVEGGIKRACSVKACRTRVYPRTDPVMICIVVKGDRCLLGRKAMYPPGWYTCLSGFIEPGESLEESVRREVAEEAGVRVGAVKYAASQPWPVSRGMFGQLMIGCIAEALSTDISCEDDELEDAAWFTREQAARAVAMSDPELRAQAKEAKAGASSNSTTSGAGGGAGAGAGGGGGGDLRIPGPWAVAHHLIRMWAVEGVEAPSSVATATAAVAAKY